MSENEKKPVLISNNAKTVERYQNHVKKQLKAIKKLKKECSYEGISDLKPFSIVLSPYIDTVPEELVAEYLKREESKTENKLPKVKINLKQQIVEVLDSDDEKVPSAAESENETWDLVDSDADTEDEKWEKKLDEDFETDGKKTKTSKKKAAGEKPTVVKKEPKAKAPVKNEDRLKRLKNKVKASSNLPKPSSNKTPEELVPKDIKPIHEKTNSLRQNFVPVFNGSPSLQNKALQSIGLRNIVSGNLSIPKKSNAELKADAARVMQSSKQPPKAGPYDAFAEIGVKQAQPEVKSAKPLRSPEVPDGLFTEVSNTGSELGQNEAVPTTLENVNDMYSLLKTKECETESNSVAKQERPRITTMYRSVLGEEEELDFDEDSDSDDGNYKRSKLHCAEATRTLTKPATLSWAVMGSEEKGSPSTDASVPVVRPVPEARIVPMGEIITECNKSRNVFEKLRQLAIFEKKRSIDWSKQEVIDFIMSKAPECFKDTPMPELKEGINFILGLCSKHEALQKGEFMNNLLSPLLERVYLGDPNMKQLIIPSLRQFNALVDEKEIFLAKKTCLKLDALVSPAAAQPVPCAFQDNLPLQGKAIHNIPTNPVRAQSRLPPPPPVSRPRDDQQSWNSAVNRKKPSPASRAVKPIVSVAPANVEASRPLRVTGPRQGDPVRVPRVDTREVPDTLDLDMSKFSKRELDLIAKTKERNVKPLPPNQSYKAHRAHTDIVDSILALSSVTGNANPETNSNTTSRVILSKDSEKQRQLAAEKRRQQQQLVDPLGLQDLNAGCESGLFDSQPSASSPALFQPVRIERKLDIASAASPSHPSKTPLPEIRRAPDSASRTETKAIPYILVAWEKSVVVYKSVYPDAYVVTAAEKHAIIPLTGVAGSEPRDPRVVVVSYAPLVPTIGFMKKQKNDSEEKEEEASIRRQKEKMEAILMERSLKRKEAKRSNPSLEEHCPRKKRLIQNDSDSVPEVKPKKMSLLEKAKWLSAKGIEHDGKVTPVGEVAFDKKGKIIKTVKQSSKVSTKLSPVKKKKVVKYYIMRKETNTQVSQISAESPDS
ncbi:hypothetical protein HDE_09728 [Halotydeus destructor]|nr:hypothetical protein HDE_09728 [Halotydeus destructor]